MIRRMFLALAIAALVIPALFGPQPVEAQGSLVIKSAKLQGLRTRPHALRVTWEITNLPRGARIEGYDIRVELSNKTASGSVFQTPSPGSTAVSVGLLGIPAATRDALFKNLGPVAANIRLKARLVVNGSRTSVETSRQFVVQ